MTKIFTVTMPDIGEGVVEGEVIQWLKKVGETLAQDEPVVVLMTDKATVELPAPTPGILGKQYYKPGEIATKGKPLYDIEVAGGMESPSPALEIAPKPKTVVPKQTSEEAPPAQEHRPPTHHKALSTPPVRKLAKELAVDLAAVATTRPDGRVTREDLQRHLKTFQTPEDVTIPHLEGDEVQPLQGIRRLTARHVAASKATIPHFSYCDSVDVSHLLQFRDRLKSKAEEVGVHLTYTPLFVRALSQTLKEFPSFNASFDRHADALVIHRPHNIGIAMKTPLGLIVPVLKEVEGLSLEQTVRAYDALRKSAIEGKLKPADMKEATFTLSNFGTEGGRWATPVISAPNVAILATAKIRDEAVVKGGEIAIRPIMNLSWSFDHRVIDGDMAAAFSNTFIKLLENPVALL